MCQERPLGEKKQKETNKTVRFNVSRGDIQNWKENSYDLVINAWKTKQMEK